jgi:hypothetical protein
MKKMKLQPKILKRMFLFSLLVCGPAQGFTEESTACVVKITSLPNNQDAVQIFLNTKGDLLDEKRLDLFGEYVQQVLKTHIKETGCVIYETEGLQSIDFTSARLLAVIQPDGSQINVLDLFPQFNDATLNFCFPYAFAKRQREQDI